jgi:BirA family biotin operon repressor/biotin-[acetyl-CoA-carboxylase] ligase
MGQTISRKAFLKILLQELERWYMIFSREGRAAILKAWKEKAQIKGRTIKVTSFNEILIGVAIDVDSEGALILETREGERRRIIAGDIEYKK